MGGERSPLSGALSGYDIRVPLRGGGYAYIEETTNAAFWRGFLRWWLGTDTQTKLSRLMHRQDGIRVVMGPTHMILPRVDGEALLRLAGEDA